MRAGRAMIGTRRSSCVAPWSMCFVEHGAITMTRKQREKRRRSTNSTSHMTDELTLSGWCCVKGDIDYFEVTLCEHYHNKVPAGLLCPQTGVDLEILENVPMLAIDNFNRVWFASHSHRLPLFAPPFGDPWQCASSCTHILSSLVTHHDLDFQRSATRGTEWTEPPPSRASFDSVMVFVFSSLFIAPCWTKHILQEATQDRHDLRVPIMALPALTAPLLFLFFRLSFNLQMWPRPLERCLPAPSCYHAAWYAPSSFLFFVLFMCLYSLYSIITGTPEVTYNTDLRGSTHVYKTAVLHWFKSSRLSTFLTD